MPALPPPGHEPPGQPAAWPAAPLATSPYGAATFGFVGPVEHPRSVAVFVLGLLSLVACGVLGPVAWVLGGRARREVRAEPGRYKESGLLTAGWVLGIVGTVLLALGLLWIALAIVLLVASASGPQLR